jgi:predicted alpha/beta hydrolase
MVASSVVASTFKVDADKAELVVADGTKLAATWFSPRGAMPERTVVIGCAIGVRRGYYEPFARFLAQQGCAALTFDYRGVGGSLDGELAMSRATISDWGELDLAGAIDAAAARFPGKVHVVGHSIGGQLLGVIGNARKLTSAVTVAAQHGYWLAYPWRQALTFGTLWYLRVPYLCAKHGYFPGKQFGIGEDLPAGVAREWGRFCTSRHYIVDRDGKPRRDVFRSFRAPVLAWSVDDDPIAPEHRVRALHALFARTTVEHRHVVPRAVGVKAIGHVGWFVAAFKRTLWRDSLEWMRTKWC